MMEEEPKKVVSTSSSDESQTLEYDILCDDVQSVAEVTVSGVIPRANTLSEDHEHILPEGSGEHGCPRTSADLKLSSPVSAGQNETEPPLESELCDITKHLEPEVKSEVSPEGDNRPPIKTFVFLDLETTDLISYYRPMPRITEIAMLAVHREGLASTNETRIIDKLVMCIDPVDDIHTRAAEITGLSNSLLQEHQKQTFNTNAVVAIRHFLKRQCPPVCLVSHNGVKFDFPILKAELSQIHGTLGNVLCGDTLQAFISIQNDLCYNGDDGPDIPSAKRPKGDLTLQSLYDRHVGSPSFYLHSAEGDTLALMKIMQKQYGVLAKWFDEHAVPFDSIQVPIVRNLAPENVLPSPPVTPQKPGAETAAIQGSGGAISNQTANMGDKQAKRSLLSDQISTTEVASIVNGANITAADTHSDPTKSKLTHLWTEKDATAPESCTYITQKLNSFTSTVETPSSNTSDDCVQDRVETAIIQPAVSSGGSNFPKPQCSDDEQITSSDTITETPVIDTEENHHETTSTCELEVVPDSEENTLLIENSSISSLDGGSTMTSKESSLLL
ncbi:uncharacterized protein [Ptychodera flava]